MTKPVTMNEVVITVKMKREFYDPLNDEQIEAVCDKITAGLDALLTPDLVRQCLQAQGLDLNQLIINIQD